MLTFGPPVVASLRRRHPSVFLDVHLAVDSPHEYVDSLKDAGASQVLFHPEAMACDPQRASELVRSTAAADTPAHHPGPLERAHSLRYCISIE